MKEDIAHQGHLAWLEEQLDQKKVALAEAKSRMDQLQSEISYFEEMRQLVANKPLFQESQTSVFPSEGHHDGVFGKQNLISGNVGLRSPKEMLLSKFSSKTLGEVILLILTASSTICSIEDVARTIFAVQDAEEYGRAKNSLSTEMRRGAKDGRWKQVGRGLFAALDTPESDFHDEFKEEYQQAEDAARKALADYSTIEYSASSNGSLPELTAVES